MKVLSKESITNELEKLKELVSAGGEHNENQLALLSIAEKCIQKQFDLKPQKTIELNDFLNYFDFSYKTVEEEEEVCGALVDHTDTYLGDIAEFRFSLDKDGIVCLIERLDMYIGDYIIRPLEERLAEIHDVDASGEDLETLVLLDRIYNDDFNSNSIASYILNPEYVILEETSDNNNNDK